MVVVAILYRLLITGGEVVKMALLLLSPFGWQMQEMLLLKRLKAIRVL